MNSNLPSATIPASGLPAYGLNQHGHHITDNGQHSHSINGAMRDKPEFRPLEMIAMRLRLHPGVKMPFDFINAHDSESCVYVFVVVNGKATTIEDDKTLFPSDVLMAQLMLLKK